MEDWEHWILFLRRAEDVELHFMIVNYNYIKSNYTNTTTTCKWKRFSFFFIYAHKTQTDSVHKYCIALIECLNIIVIERKRSRQKQLKSVKSIKQPKARMCVVSNQVE